jgi:hypothetical protein
MKIPAFLLSLFVFISIAFTQNSNNDFEEKLKNYDYSGRSAVYEEALRADISVESGEITEKPEDIIVGFTLTNTASLPVRIWKRWNTWGAFAWSFRATSSDGITYTLENPSKVWTVNFPDPLDIPVGGSHTEHFRIYDGRQWAWYYEDDTGNKQTVAEPERAQRSRHGLLCRRSRTFMNNPG